MYDVYLHPHRHTNIVSDFIYGNGTVYIDVLFVKHSVVSHSGVIIAHTHIDLFWRWNRVISNLIQAVQ